MITPALEILAMFKSLLRKKIHVNVYS